jgi:glycerol uptake facilitator-like aquaporin
MHGLLVRKCIVEFIGTFFLVFVTYRLDTGLGLV